MTNKTLEEKAKEIIENSFGEASGYILERVSVEDFICISRELTEDDRTETRELREKLEEAISLCNYSYESFRWCKDISQSETSHERSLKEFIEEAKQLIKSKK